MGRQQRLFRLGRNRAFSVLVFYIDGTEVSKDGDVSETFVPPVLLQTWGFIKQYFEPVRRDTVREGLY